MFYKKYLRKHIRWQTLSGTICLLSAAFIYWLWGHWEMSGFPPKSLGGDLAQPGGWRQFSVLILPAICFGPSLVLMILQWFYPRERHIWNLALRRDLQATIIISLLWAMVPINWRYAEAPLVYMASVYILGLILKGRSLLGWLLADFKWNRRQAVALLVVLWTLLGGLAVWGEKSITTYGDAVIYLLNAHTLARYGNLDIAKAVDNGEYREFYRTNWSINFKQLASDVNATLFPFILAGPYFIAGRLGVQLFHALLLACAAVLITDWLLRQTRVGPRQCLFSSLLVIFSAPVIFLSHVEFPDTVGLFAVSLGLWFLSYINTRFGLVILGQVALLGLLYYTKKTTCHFICWDNFGLCHSFRADQAGKSLDHPASFGRFDCFGIRCLPIDARYHHCNLEIQSAALPSSTAYLDRSVLGPKLWPFHKRACILIGHGGHSRCVQTLADRCSIRIYNYRHIH